MHTSLSFQSSFVLDVEGLRLDAKFIDVDGEVKDYLTLKKTIAEEGDKER